MDDLISRQEAIDAVENCEPGEELFMIESLPSIDAVPAVRCKDCNHLHLEKGTWTCVFALPSGPDGYCSYGERRRKMSDLISRKELLESIEKVSVKGNVLDDDWVYRFVQEFPSIDAVPVVRCKNCKYYKENTLACSRYGLEDDDYCSWAERRE